MLKHIQAYVLYETVTKTCKHLGSHNAGKLNSSWICLLGGPEDDLLGRNMSSWQIYCFIYNKCCVNDWCVVFVRMFLLRMCVYSYKWTRITECARETFMNITLIFVFPCSVKLPKIGNLQLGLPRKIVAVKINENIPDSNVYWTVHHCSSWGMKDQLDVTFYFISIIMRSTCFGH